MRHALEEALDHRVLGRSRAVHPVVERGCIAETLALDEVIAEEGGEEDVVAPPLLGVAQRRADRRPRIAGEEVGEREVNGPGRDIVEVVEDVAQDHIAVLALGEGGERCARQHPPRPDGVVLHGVDRHLRVGQHLHRLQEFRVVLKRARVRGGACLWLDRQLQRPQLVCQSLRGESWRGRKHLARLGRPLLRLTWDEGRTAGGRRRQLLEPAPQGRVVALEHEPDEHADQDAIRECHRGIHLHGRSTRGPGGDCQVSWICVNETRFLPGLPGGEPTQMPLKMLIVDRPRRSAALCRLAHKVRRICCLGGEAGDLRVRL